MRNGSNMCKHFNWIWIQGYRVCEDCGHVEYVVKSYTLPAGLEPKKGGRKAWKH